MSESRNFPSHLGGEFLDVKPEDLPNELLVASTVGSHVKAGCYLDEIVYPRLADAEAEGKTDDVIVLREIARTMLAIAGETYRNTN